LFASTSGLTFGHSLIGTAKLIAERSDVDEMVERSVKDALHLWVGQQEQQ
jgi:hypothetical protein